MSWDGRMVSAVVPGSAQGGVADHGIATSRRAPNGSMCAATSRHTEGVFRARRRCRPSGEAHRWRARDGDGGAECPHKTRPHVVAPDVSPACGAVGCRRDGGAGGGDRFWREPRAQEKRPGEQWDVGCPQSLIPGRPRVGPLITGCQRRGRAHERMRARAAGPFAPARARPRGRARVRRMRARCACRPSHARSLSARASGARARSHGLARAARSHARRARAPLRERAPCMHWPTQGASASACRAGAPTRPSAHPHACARTGSRAHARSRARAPCGVRGALKLANAAGIARASRQRPAALRLTTCDLLPTTYYLLPTTYCLLPSTCYLLRAN